MAWPAGKSSWKYPRVLDFKAPPRINPSLPFMHYYPCPALHRWFVPVVAALGWAGLLGLPAGVAIALYPLSAFRAMNKAALKVYEGVRRDGTQKNVVDTMQTRMELYDFLGYHEFEKKLDQLFAKEK